MLFYWYGRIIFYSTDNSTLIKISVKKFIAGNTPSQNAILVLGILAFLMVFADLEHEVSVKKNEIQSVLLVSKKASSDPRLDLSQVFNILNSFTGFIFISDPVFNLPDYSTLFRNKAPPDFFL